MTVIKDMSLIEMALLMAPFAVLMVLALFGMDERVATRQVRGGGRRRFCEVGRDGRGSLSDPHGESVNGSGFPRRKAIQSGNSPQDAFLQRTAPPTKRKSL